MSKYSSEAISSKADIEPLKRRQAALASAFGARLQDCLSGKTYQWLSDETGISTSMLSDYGKGKKVPGADKVVLIADALQVQIDWLIAGRGSKTGRYFIPADIDAHYRAKYSAKSGVEEDLVPIREIDLTFGMGATYLDVPITEEMHRFPRAWIRRYTRAAPDQLFFAQGLGDSMEPTLYDSDLLLIDSSQRQLNMAEKIWAIAYAECGMIKRLRPVPGGGVEVWSDKKEVSPFTAYDGELEIIGRVVAVQRKL